MIICVLLFDDDALAAATDCRPDLPVGRPPAPVGRPLLPGPRAPELLIGAGRPAAADFSVVALERPAPAAFAGPPDAVGRDFFEVRSAIGLLLVDRSP
jgi:hypothetical protein